jgi:hypothetical protein
MILILDCEPHVCRSEPSHRPFVHWSRFFEKNRPKGYFELCTCKKCGLKAAALVKEALARKQAVWAEVTSRNVTRLVGPPAPDPAQGGGS